MGKGRKTIESLRGEKTKEDLPGLEETVLRIGGVSIKVDSEGRIAGKTLHSSSRRIVGSKKQQKKAKFSLPDQFSTSDGDDGSTTSAWSSEGEETEEEKEAAGNGSNDDSEEEEEEEEEIPSLQDYLEHVEITDDEDWEKLYSFNSSVVNWTKSQDMAGPDDGPDVSEPSSASSSCEEEEIEMLIRAPAVLTAEDLECLSLAQKFPVQARPRIEQHAARNKKHKPIRVKGANGGKLAPGEKAKLKKLGREDKRAARAASKGFNLAAVNEQLIVFVKCNMDMYALKPMGKRECREASHLASLYGILATVQGSGKKRMTIIHSTSKTAMPEGKAALLVSEMIAQRITAEHRGALLDGKLKKLDKKRAPNAKSLSSSYNKPVAFVSSGIIDPATSKVELIDSTPLAEMVQVETELEVFEDLVGENMYQKAGQEDMHAAAFVGPPSLRGCAAAQGITNPGRLLGLGMALGIGPEVFGAPGPINETHDAFHIVSSVEPQLSKSEAKRRGLRKSKSMFGRTPNSAQPPLASSGDRFSKGKVMDDDQIKNAGVSGDFGYFERHTSGIGSKLLEKMGWQAGRGIGAGGAGISEPIKVTQRAKNLGLGAN